MKYVMKLPNYSPNLDILTNVNVRFKNYVI